MILKVVEIDEIIVTDIDGNEVKVAKGETFEASERNGQNYLNSYPQFFRVGGSKSEDEIKEEGVENVTVAELKEAIKALGGTPTGNKLVLFEQLKQLQADKAEADEKERLAKEAEAEAEAKAKANAEATNTAPDAQ